ncbi:MAG: hypothetical protein WCG03_05945 [Kiritimatiellales bacterium]
MFDKNHLMRSIFQTSGILLLLLLLGCGEHTSKKASSRQTEARFRDYKVIISESDERDALGGDLSRVEIFKGKVLVYAMDGHRFEVGTRFGVEEIENTAPIGTDITGDGQPNLVISEYTGGAHCCHDLHIFEIGRNFRHIQTIELEHSGADFKNLDDDSALELPIDDWTFAYWNAAFAESPAPEVILKYSEGQYRMAPKLMKKLPRRQAELIETAAKIKLMPDWTVPDPTRVPPDLWREMLDLIYTGNMAQAWKLFDFAWPEGMSGKEKFFEELKAQLATSPYWEQIQDMNKNRSVEEP